MCSSDLANDAHDQGQTQDPPSHEQDQGQDQSKVDGDSPSDDQDQAHHDGHPQDDEHVHCDDGDEDQDSGDDQEASQESINEAETRRKERIARAMARKEHLLENVLGDVRGKVSTRNQLANFSNHHAYVSMVEPQKVRDALEDPEWMEAMHEELNNFKRNKVWQLVERPKECRNFIDTKWIDRKSVV